MNVLIKFKTEIFCMIIAVFIFFCGRLSVQKETKTTTVTSTKSNTVTNQQVVQTTQTTSNYLQQTVSFTKTFGINGKIASENTTQTYYVNQTEKKDAIKNDSVVTSNTFSTIDTTTTISKSSRNLSMGFIWPLSSFENPQQVKLNDINAAVSYRLFDTITLIGMTNYKFNNAQAGFLINL